MSHPSHWTHFDEQQVRDEFWKIHQGDFILDIGAAYGSYSLQALALGADKIWAWSPQGVPGECTEYELFSSSLELNGWRDKVEIYGDHGLYDAVGWVDTVSQQFFSDPPETNPAIIEVRTLDNWLSLINPAKIDWIKMDVEGAELKVLQGGIQTIEKFKPKIMVENHTFKIPTIESDVLNYLLEVGYEHVKTMPYSCVSHSLYIPKI